MRIALVTCAEARPLDEDLAPLAQALGDAGAQAEVWDWRDATRDWAGVDAAVVRSTWDYFHDLAAFLAWVDRVGAATTLLNPPAAVRWSADKRYLTDLAARGVPVVPTRFVAPGEEVGEIGGDVVVKPSVGAGSNDARRFTEGGPAAREHAEAIARTGRTAMLQPYLSGVDSLGETGMLFAGDRFSHAFRKGAILGGPDIAFVEGLYAAEEISPREASTAELAVARLALDAAPERTTYARVDVIPGADGEPLVLEVELIEPSLFLGIAPGSAARFAEAIVSAAA